MKLHRPLFVTLTFAILSLWCNGQVSVIGHASAEVVEGVSARYIENSDPLISGEELNQIELGTFNISGKALSTFSVVVDNARLWKESGELVMLDTLPLGSSMSTISDQDGNQSLNMVANAGEKLSTGQYYGNYGVTFAYN